MNKSLEQLQEYYEVEEEDLDYIGFTVIREGKTLEQYNIMDPSHKNYKSTVAFIKEN